MPSDTCWERERERARKQACADLEKGRGSADPNGKFNINELSPGHPPPRKKWGEREREREVGWVGGIVDF